MNEPGPSRKRGSRPRSLGSLRLVEIEKLLRARGLDTAPASHLVVVVHHALFEFPDPAGQKAIDAARDHLEVIARHLPFPQREEIVERAALSCRRWTARALGEVLALTEDERRRLDIRSIRFSGQTRRDQRDAKRRRDRTGAAERRRDQGAVARKDYLDAVKSTAELARLHGVSERTIRRWRAAGTMPEKPDVRGSSHIVSRRETYSTAGPRTLDPCGGRLGAAGPEAPASPPDASVPSVAHTEITRRVGEIGMIARQCADRVDIALLAVRLAARRVSGSR